MLQAALQEKERKGKPSAAGVRKQSKKYENRPANLRSVPKETHRNYVMESVAAVITAASRLVDQSSFVLIKLDTNWS